MLTGLFAQFEQMTSGLIWNIDGSVCQWFIGEDIISRDIKETKHANRKLAKKHETGKIGNRKGNRQCGIDKA
jgi:hypothetical protein